MYLLAVLCLLFVPGEAYYIPENEKTLKLLHIIFRHGNRTIDPTERYPKDPYYHKSYFPIGLGELTRAGKQREFSIGTEVRDKYGHFLGHYYYPEIVESWSTDYNRTKASLLLVLAGLFPPVQHEEWETDLRWQPVPFNYRPRDQDKVLLGVLCPEYTRIYNENYKSRRMQKELAEYEDVFDYLTRHTGIKFETYLQAYNLYFALATEEEYGLHLPEWTKNVWPEPITQLAIREYFAAMGTPELEQMAVGYFFEKMLHDTYNKLTNSESHKKLYLYSAHESNVAEILMALDIFDPHIPTYGSYIAFEVHTIGGVDGIKVYYQNYTTWEPRLMTLPRCGEFCPLEDFEKLTKHLIPTRAQCGRRNDD